MQLLISKRKQKIDADGIVGSQTMEKLINRIKKTPVGKFLREPFLFILHHVVVVIIKNNFPFIHSVIISFINITITFRAFVINIILI